MMQKGAKSVPAKTKSVSFLALSSVIFNWILSKRVTGLKKKSFRDILK